MMKAKALLLASPALLFQAHAMTWAELGRQNQPAAPVFHQPEPVQPRYWQARPANTEQWGVSPAGQPPTPLLYWSWYQSGSYDNPWTLGYRDGWWAPPVRWSTPLSPWTQYQLYQWWARQPPALSNPQHSNQP